MRQSVRKTLLIAVCAVFVCTVMAFAAACGPKAYTLTFVTNGGTEITPITAEAGTAITPPSDPSRDGYSFDGWFETENFSGDAVEIPTTMPDRNITYYAKFTELPKAKLSLDAGEVGTLETSEFEVTVGTNVSEFLADIVPTVSGDVTFGGWFDGDVALSDKQTMPAEGLSLTAKYQVGFTVEVFLQDVEGDGYTQDESASFEQTGWLGDTVTAAPSTSMRPPVTALILPVRRASCWGRGRTFSALITTAVHIRFSTLPTHPRGRKAPEKCRMRRAFATVHPFQSKRAAFPWKDTVSQDGLLRQAEPWRISREKRSPSRGAA